MIVKYKEKIGNIKREYKGLLKNKLNFKKSFSMFLVKNQKNIILRQIVKLS